MNNKFKLVALGAMLTASSTVVHATLSGGEILDFTDGVTECLIFATPSGCHQNLTKVTSGSYFAMDTNGSGAFDQPERVAIENTGTGVTLGVAQVIGAVDTPWSFGNNLGRHHTSNGLVPSVNVDGSVNMNGWTVYWGASGGEVNINMGTGASATITCTSGTNACLPGETFALDYETVVPAGEPFENVPYQLHLEGTVVVLSGTTAPTAVDDPTETVIRSSTGNSFNILLNDTDPEANIDISTIIIQTPPTDGTATVNANGTVSYDNNGTTLDDDFFTYTVKDIGTLESNTATVTITIENAGVFAKDDAGSMDTATDATVGVLVTDNDADGEGAGINLTSVVVTQQPVKQSAPTESAGSATHIGDGVIEYTPLAGFVGTAIMKYTVENNDGTLSNEASVVISVNNSILGVLQPDDYLIFNTGNVPVQSVVPPLGEGSWFSMGVIPAAPTHTSLAGFNHIHLGEAQLASSPDDEPFIPLVQNIDQAWNFFGQLGVSQSIAPITILTDDGAGNVTLDLSVWNVSWNGIPSISLNNGADNGIATLTCYIDLVAGTPGNCSYGDEFLLTYRATVPQGDPSNFGGVNYVLHLEGVISDVPAGIVLPVAPSTSDIQAFDPDGVAVIVKPGDRATSAGSATGSNISASDLGLNDPKLNPKDGEQCIGGCVDFVITDITADYVDVVFKLSKELPEGAIYRKYINGKWADFNQSENDLVGSNLAVVDVCTNATFSIGLRTGDNCILLRIYDGGPNDADGVKNGTIVDPSGALLAGSQNVPASSTSGCSISNKPVSIADRADWLLVAAFLAVLGLVNVKRRNFNS